MDFWPAVVFGTLPFFILLIGIKLYLGHPLVPFGLVAMSLWCSVVAVGTMNLFVSINEIRRGIPDDPEGLDETPGN